MKRKPRPKRPYLLAVLLLLMASNAHAECRTLGGVQWSRWVYDGSRAPMPVKQDGATQATVGYACGVLEGQEYSLDLGGNVGVLVDSEMFTRPVSTIGVFVGGTWLEGKTTIGLTPHHVNGETWTAVGGYGVGFSLTTKVWTIFSAVGGLFTDAFDESFKEEGD
jgi:hypothetical protein